MRRSSQANGATSSMTQPSPAKKRRFSVVTSSACIALYGCIAVVAAACIPLEAEAFATPAFVHPRSPHVDPSSSRSSSAHSVQVGDQEAPSNDLSLGKQTMDASAKAKPSSNRKAPSSLSSWQSSLGALGLGVAILANLMLGGAVSAVAASGSYDGFAEYAKENQMEQSDVKCFVQKCGDETKNLFSNPRGIKGVSCLGRCKGEQSCATRCFAEFGSENLNNWLSCTIEENECVKVPKNVDNSAENIGYPTALKNFDPKSLVDGSPWYKTDGLNPNYDLFDCQTNTFQASSSSSNPNKELDMGIFFRVRRPEESGGGFWENALTEHMVVDAAQPFEDDNPTGRTMHTSGKMYGLKFSENWYILGESDGSGSVPPFKLVAYKGHTLQGNYEGAFVYAKEAVLPEAAKPAIREAAARAGLDFDKFTRIDNTCPVGNALNDAEAGTGTSTTDWVDLVIGEGGVIDWISPGWRGEYNKK